MAGRRTLKVIFIPAFLVIISIIFLYEGLIIKRHTLKTEVPPVLRIPAQLEYTTTLSQTKATSTKSKVIQAVFDWTTEPGLSTSDNSIPTVSTDKHEVPTAGLTLDQEHKNRIDHLQEACLDPATFRNVTTRRSLVPEYFLSKEYDFAYCKVPKSGSTFWMQLFLLLQGWPSNRSSLFKMSRAEVHIRSRKLKTSPRAVYKSRSKIILVSRNPYTRLFSAYIDKVYLPLFWEQLGSVPGIRKAAPYQTFMNKTIKGKLFKKKVMVTPICANNVTFKAFLKFIIDQVNRRRPLEPHWAPITNLCYPCRMNTHIVIRQESFVKDVEFALNKLGINSSRYSVLTEAMHDHRAESSIPGIVSVVSTKSLFRHVRPCIEAEETGRRIWNSLKIQGYLDKSVQFPTEYFQRFTRFPRDQFTKLILEAIEKHKMTPEEGRRQRNAYLVEAYKGIPHDLIEKIQKIYKTDFLLFNYSLSPPS